MEPIYGKDAFHSIAETVFHKNPYSPLTRKDLEWIAPWSSNVETQTFYFTAPSGHYGFVQVIHSNPIGLHFTAQFTCRVVHDDKPEESVWTSTNLEDIEARGTEFNAHNMYITLNEDATEYTISSSVNEDSIVELTATRTAPGFKIGKTGTSLYGDDIENPWGSMRHVFWPRAEISGTIKVKGKDIVLERAHSLYVMAMQGMKPHHAASRWNFVNFQGPTSSLVVMEFTTPPSYGSCTVGVAAVTRDDKLIYTSTDVKVDHIDAVEDEVGWPAPKKIAFTTKGPGVDETDEAVAAAEEAPEADKSVLYKSKLTGDLEGHLVERVDVMAELPMFVKRVASGLSGTKPYIYQFSDRGMKFLLTNPDGSTFEEVGHGFCETTFIS